MQPFTPQSAQVLLLVLGLLGLSVLFSFPDYYLQLAYSGIVIVLGFCVPVYLLNISPDLNDVWRRICTRLKPE
jgi:hypothetical protein